MTKLDKIITYSSHFLGTFFSLCAETLKTQWHKRAIQCCQLLFPFFPGKKLACLHSSMVQWLERHRKWNSRCTASIHHPTNIFYIPIPLPPLFTYIIAPPFVILYYRPPKLFTVTSFYCRYITYWLCIIISEQFTFLCLMSLNKTIKWHLDFYYNNKTTMHLTPYLNHPEIHLYRIYSFESFLYQTQEF